MRAELRGGRGMAVLAIVAAVATVAVVGATAMGGEPSGEAVLNDTRERYANAESVVWTADVTVTNGSGSTEATVEFVASGDRSRVVVTRGGETFRGGNNGTVAWYVGPDRAGARELDALRWRNGSARPWIDATVPAAAWNPTRDDHDIDDSNDADAADIDVEYVRAGSDDGTDAHVLRVTPANGSENGRATLWIAEEDSRLLRVEATDGENSTVVDFRETRFDVSVHGSTFDPPADRVAVTAVERYDDFASAQARTAIDLPRLDAAFRGARAFHRSGDTLIAQRYAAGDDVLTLVSTTRDRPFDRTGANATQVSVGDHEATVATAGSRSVVAWQADGVTTAVVVEAGEDRAVELARRVAE